MAFDINTVIGLQGLSVEVRPLHNPTPGLYGWTAGSRETIDVPGIYGWSLSVKYNTAFTFSLTNFIAINDALTISISWNGHSAETYIYSSDFVTTRLFPTNTLITVQTSGITYNTTTTTFTLTDDFARTITTVNLPLTIATIINTNSYRRRRYTNT